MKSSKKGKEDPQSTINQSINGLSIDEVRGSEALLGAFAARS